MDYAALLGARIVDEIVPGLDEPPGWRSISRRRDGAMFFPPVTGVVPDTAAVDAEWRGTVVGGDGVDLSFDQASVVKFTQGVGATIDQLGDLGGATGSVMGKGFSELAMTGMEAGHHGLSVDFEDFCERWEWGVRALVSDASAIANRLGLAAGTQWEHDQYVEGTSRSVSTPWRAAIRTPRGGDHPAGWDEVFKPDYLDPDWSKESWEQAGQDIEQTWKDTGRTVSPRRAGLVI
ncbi:hypothetical protein GCM10023238_32070 [Streptomyces heliomycini]